MRNRNILICGASVAGPALAYWLRRRGFNPTVVERAAAPRPGGQAVDLRGAARDVAERMGLLERIRSCHTGTHGLAYVDSADRRVAALAGAAFGDSGGPIAEIEILRGDLVRILYDATRDGVEYLFGDAVTGVAETDDGVLVSFEQAAPRTFDLVVGADGMHSTVRRLAFPAGSWRVEDAGYHRAVFATDRDFDLDGWEVMYNMPAGNGTAGGRMVLVYPTRDGARAMFFFASDPMPYDRRDIEAQKRIVADVYAGEGWHVSDLLSDLETSSDFYFDRVGTVSVDRWSHGRVTLLGDACSAGSVGMGTSLAVVGAYVLAGELAAADGAYGPAFARYQDGMRDYVTRNMKPLPGGIKGFLPPTERRIRLRNRLIRTLVRLPVRGLMTGGMDKAVSAITLKDYPQAGPALTGAGPGASPRR